MSQIALPKLLFLVELSLAKPFSEEFTDTYRAIIHIFVIYQVKNPGH